MQVKKLKFEDKIPLGEDGLMFQLPPMPDERDIEGYELPSAKQMFRRKVFMPEKQFYKLERSTQVEIVTEELIKRTHGHWLFINGVPTWLSPSHYFFLHYWFMAAITQDGMPDYRWAQAKWAYFIEHCEADEFCFGGIMMSGKRFSKTEFCLAHLYNVSTRGAVRTIGGLKIPDEDMLCGMQSLKGDEAKKNLFKGRIIRSHRKIPNYLKPKSNDSIGKSEISSELTFFGDKSGDNSKDALNNVIDWRPTNESAYQGKRPRAVYWDEPGTMEEMDIYEAWGTLKQQLQIGKRAFGKHFMPATLEAMTPRGAPLFQKLWNESDPRKRDDNGRTASWMYRYFNPQYEGREDFIDQYGNSLVDEAKKFRANELVIASPSRQKKIKRQYPETVDEAFDVVVSNFWESDVQSILSAIKRQFGDADVHTKKVTLFEHSTGDIKFDASKEDDETGTLIFEDPKPHVNYYAGFDGTASDKETGNEKGSCVSVTIIKGADGGNGYEYLPVAYFKFRPEKMTDGYKATLNICRHYGQFGNLKLGIERNAGQGSPLIAFFINKGYRKMLMKKQKITGVDNEKDTELYGWYRNQDVIDVQKSYANEFLRNFAHNIPFPELIDSLIDYGKSNQDFADSFISAVYTMGDPFKSVKKKATNPPPQTIEILAGIAVDNQGMTYENWINIPA